MSSPMRQSSSAGQQVSPSRHQEARGREDIHPQARQQHQQQHQQQEQQYYGHHGLQERSSLHDGRSNFDVRHQRALDEQRPQPREQYHTTEQRDQHSGQRDQQSTSDRYSAWQEQHRQATYEASSYGPDSRVRPDYPAILPRSGGTSHDTRAFEHPPAFMPQRSFLPGPSRHELQEGSSRSREAEQHLSPTLRHPQATAPASRGPPSSWAERPMADALPGSSRAELSHALSPANVPESQTPSVLAPSAPAPPPAWRPNADEHEQSAIERPGGNAATPICSNCATLTTPLWRRDGRGGLLCNACGLFVRVKGRPRPVSMKTDVIKSRARRSKVGMPLVGSGAAAAAPDYSIPENARYGGAHDAYRSRDTTGEGSSPETSMSLDRSEESGSWRETYGGREAGSSRMAPGQQQAWNYNDGLARTHLPPYGPVMPRNSPREPDSYQPSPSSFGSSMYESRRSDYFEDPRESQRNSRYPGQGSEGAFMPPAGPAPMLPSASRIEQQMRLGPPPSEFAPPPGWRGARLPPLMAAESDTGAPRLPALMHSSFPPPIRRSSYERGVVGGGLSIPSSSSSNSDAMEGPAGGRSGRRRSSDSRTAPYQKRRFDEAAPPSSLQSRPLSGIVDGPPPRLPGLHSLQHPSDGGSGSLRLPPLSSLTGPPGGRPNPGDSMQRREPM